MEITLTEVEEEGVNPRVEEKRDCGLCATIKETKWHRRQGLIDLVN